MAEKKVTFEQAMARLEEIVKQLEQGDAPLEDALALFEEGTRLMKKCTTQLDKAEQKVSKLLAGPAESASGPCWCWRPAACAAEQWRMPCPLPGRLR